MTALIGDIRFARPIAVGELVEVEARITHTGRTSMHVFITVYSGGPRGGELSETAHCLTMFARHALELAEVLQRAQNR